MPAWLSAAKLGLLLALSMAAFLWKPLRPLRNFFIVMAAFFSLFALLPRFDFTLPFLQNLFGHSVFDVRMQAEQTGKLAVSVVMIVVLLLFALPVTCALAFRLRLLLIPFFRLVGVRVRRRSWVANIIAALSRAVTTVILWRRLL